MGALFAAASGGAPLALSPVPSRGVDRGASGGKGGKTKGPPAGAHTESAVRLPPPPKPPPVPEPPSAAAVAKAAALVTENQSLPHADVKLLDALISHARSSKDVPQSLQQLLDQRVQDDSKMQAKRLHALVSQQQTARAQLRKIHADKVLFETNWEQYLKQLAQTLDSQTKERAGAIQALGRPRRLGPSS